MADRTETFEARIEEACAWAARVAADDADWAAFTAWLEADPANGAAYDVVSDVEAEVEALAPELRRLARSSPARPGTLTRRGWTLALAGSSVAAAVGLWAVVGGPSGPPHAPATDYVTQALPGGPVPLRTGATARLDANSRMRVARDGTAVELTAGAAYFDVAHDPTRTLVVTVGGVEVRDIGTRFDVTLSPGGEVFVAVAEGQVDVQAKGARNSITVAGGERLIVPSAGRATRMPIDAEEVASWRRGSLHYRGAPLVVVAADVSRYAGRTVVADPRVADLRFTGVITIGDGTRLVQTLEQFLPIRAETRDGVTRLEPRDGP